MRTDFNKATDELEVRLDKPEREAIRHVRNLTRELARYTADCEGISKALTIVLSRIGEDGKYATKPVEPGSTETVPGSEVIKEGAAGSEALETTPTATRKGGGR